MRRRIHLFYVFSLFLSLIFTCYFIYQSHLYHTKLIAVSWSMKNFDNSHKYGVFIYAGKRFDNKIQIKMKVYSGDGFFSHDLGVIGIADVDRSDINFPSVVEQWGMIIWRPEGVYIGGDASYLYFLPREKLVDL